MLNNHTHPINLLGSTPSTLFIGIYFPVYISVAYCYNIVCGRYSDVHPDWTVWIIRHVFIFLPRLCVFSPHEGKGGVSLRL